MEREILCLPGFMRSAPDSEVTHHIKSRKRVQKVRAKRPRLQYGYPFAPLDVPKVAAPEATTTYRLPQELLIEVFRCVDLSSRAKIRGVCPYWKYLVSLPEVNEIVHIDTKVFGGPLGVWQGDDYRLPHTEDAPYMKGVLGNHVRYLTYNGRTLDRCQPDCCLISQQLVWMRSRCPLVEHLYVQNVVFRCWPEYQDNIINTQTFVINRLWSDLFGVDELAMKTVTLTDCELLYTLNVPLRGPRYAASADKIYKWIVDLPKVSLDWKGDRMDNIRQTLAPLIWPFPDEQLDWVAQYTALLPHYCDGPLTPLAATREAETGEHADLAALDYYVLDKATLVFFARVIMTKKNADGTSMFPPPPYPFPEKYLLLESRD